MSFFNELKRRNVVRVGVAYTLIAWVLVQVGETVLPAFEVPDAVLRGLVIVLILGFPAVLVFAWVFEMTPEGIKLEKNVDRGASITTNTGRKLDRLIIFALSMAVVILLADRFLNRGPEAEAPGPMAEVAGPAEVGGPAEEESATPSAQGEPSVAVLPFVNMSDDPSNEYFSDGISEELLNVLVKVRGIKVVSRTSSFAFKDKDVGIPEIARQLSVDHVLEGSVRKSGNRVRVTAQLIDVRSDRHLWSETYDRELEDIFAIQDEISGHIVDALQVALGTGEAQSMSDAGRPTQDLEAYEYFLQGRYFWQRRGEANIRKAIELLQRAISVDPTFARAWAALAAAYITLPTYSTEPFRESFAKAREAAEKALALDDSLADAYAVLGDVTRMSNDWQGAEKAYLAAIEREPNNATAQLWYAEFLLVIGRVDDAVRHNEIAYGLDPLSPGANVNLAMAMSCVGRDEEALRLARAGKELGHAFGAVIEGIIHLERGEYDQAVVRFDEGDRLFAAQGRTLGPIAESLRDGERPAAVARALALADNGAPAFVTFLGLVLTGDGEAPVRFALAHQEELPLNSWFHFWGGSGAALRHTQEFAELVRQLGMIDYWRKAGWPDLCRPDGDGIACR